MERVIFSQTIKGYLVQHGMQVATFTFHEYGSKAYGLALTYSSLICSTKELQTNPLTTDEQLDTLEAQFESFKNFLKDAKKEVDKR